MKSKGFILIELLAVIIILGILILIAIPSVTNYINNSRKSTYVNTVAFQSEASQTQQYEIKPTIDVPKSKIDY